MLTHEPGSGLPDAESYASVAAADAYHAARRTAVAWAALTTGAKESALREATDHMLQEYRGRWKGQRVSSTQSLDWPRAWVVVEQFGLPSDAVPAEVVKACCELAAKASAGPLKPDQGAQVLSKEVGPLKTVYAHGARQGTRFAAVDDLLRPLLAGSGSMRLVRA